MSMDRGNAAVATLNKVTLRRVRGELDLRSAISVVVGVSAQ